MYKRDLNNLTDNLHFFDKILPQSLLFQLLVFLSPLDLTLFSFEVLQFALMLFPIVFVVFQFVIKNGLRYSFDHFGLPRLIKFCYSFTYLRFFCYLFRLSPRSKN